MSFTASSDLPDARDAVPHDLAGAEGAAGIENISLADVIAVHADFLGENVHDSFHRELGLVAAKSAHGSAHRIVRENGGGRNIHVRHAVNSRRVAGRAQQALRACARIGACIADHARAHRQQAALRVRAHCVMQRNGMALGMDERGLLARENALHGTLQQIARPAPFAPESSSPLWLRKHRRWRPVALPRPPSAASRLWQYPCGRTRSPGSASTP